MMARTWWLDTAALLGLTLLVVADTDVNIPPKCPNVDSVNHAIQLGHETDCTKFYKCSRGKMYLMDCPRLDDEGNKLYFNGKLQLCDWPWNVDCKLPEPSTRNKVRVEIPKTCPKYDSIHYTVHLAHENDCTKFYKCSHGKKWEMECPIANEFGDRLHFNAALQICDWPEDANCDVSIECKGTCPSVNEDFIATLPHKKNCAKYCLCQKGYGKVMDCPIGMHFDVASGVCDDPSKVECNLYSDADMQYKPRQDTSRDSLHEFDRQLNQQSSIS